MSEKSVVKKPASSKIRSEFLSAYATLMRLSLPKMSVPKMCSLLGAKFTAIKSVKFGSNLEKNGVTKANVTSTKKTKQAKKNMTFLINFSYLPR